MFLTKAVSMLPRKEMAGRGKTIQDSQEIESLDINEERIIELEDKSQIYGIRK